MSRITPGGPGGGQQLRFHRVLAHQTRENTGHHRSTVVAANRHDPSQQRGLSPSPGPIRWTGERRGDPGRADRISAFVRWVARTPWPVFTLGMLQADIIGALFVLGFLRFGLPAEDRIQLQDLPAFNLAIFLGYLLVSFTVGFVSDACGC